MKFKKLFFKLTGGRPMRLRGIAYINNRTWKPVYIYRDRKHNDLWLAKNAWGFERLSVPHYIKPAKEKIKLVVVKGVCHD